MVTRNEASCDVRGPPIAVAPKAEVKGWCQGGPEPPRSVRYGTIISEESAEDYNYGAYVTDPRTWKSLIHPVLELQQTRNLRSAEIEKKIQFGGLTVTSIIRGCEMVF